MNVAEQVPVDTVRARLLGLRGYRLTLALVGEPEILDRLKTFPEVRSLNPDLIQRLESTAQMPRLVELEEAGLRDSVRESLQELFEEWLREEVGRSPRLLLAGLETLLYFGVNLRPVRQYAVNDRPIGLILPGSVDRGVVQYYHRQPVDCEFDQIWEITA